MLSSSFTIKVKKQTKNQTKTGNTAGESNFKYSQQQRAGKTPKGETDNHKGKTTVRHA